MDKKGVIFRFVKYYLKRMIQNPKFYMVMVCVMLLFYHCYRGMGGNLLNTQDTVPIFALYTFSLDSIRSLSIYMFGWILLVCDVPSLEQGLENYLIRANRKVWVRSQIIYVGVLMSIYHVLLEITMVISCGGRVSLVDQWGNSIMSALSTSPEAMGVLPIFDLSFGLINSYTPFIAFLQQMLLTLLLSFFVAELFMLFNILLRGQMGYLVVILFMFLDVLISGNPVIHKLSFISPFTMSRLSQLELDFSSEYPTFGYAVGFFVISIGLVYYIIERCVKKYDFAKLDKMI